VQVRPSTKLVVVGYIASLILAAVISFFVLRWDEPSDWKWAVMIIPAIALISVFRRHMQRRLTKLTIEGDRLRFESGLLSKSTRTMELFKVQDVRVDQSLGQRMLNVGNLSIETAGSSSHITIDSIDDPQRTADHILQMARANHPKAEGA
jgi:membrane protein YdbS with pleckstrin-like domain